MKNQMAVLFHITPSSGTPIYKQIIEQVTRLVASGHLKPGDELPSVRQAANYLEVNPMTISKAYSLLEATNVLERIRGKGMVVASNQKEQEDVDARLALLKPALTDAVTQARQLALPNEVVLNAFTALLENRK